MIYFYSKRFRFAPSFNKYRVFDVFSAHQLAMFPSFNCFFLKRLFRHKPNLSQTWYLPKRILGNSHHVSLVGVWNHWLPLLCQKRGNYWYYTLQCLACVLLPLFESAGKNFTTQLTLICTANVSQDALHIRCIDLIGHCNICLLLMTSAF